MLCSNFLRKYTAAPIIGLIAVGLFCNVNQSMDDKFVRSSILFTDGKKEVNVKEIKPECNTFKLSEDHLQFVLNLQELKNWLGKNDKKSEELGFLEFSKEKEIELTDILARHIQKLDPEKAGKCTKWQLSSVIYRQMDASGSEASYTNAVHRDLSEDSVQNLKTHQNQYYYYNAWIPRDIVHNHPLGLILPDSVNIKTDASGFMGLENDYTGLLHNLAHNWIYYPALNVGDTILWHSEIVYHASFSVPNSLSNVPRSSMDFRIYFEKD